MPFNPRAFGIAADEAISSLADELEQAVPVSASTAFTCSSRISKPISSRMICAFRCTGKGRPSPCLRVL